MDSCFSCNFSPRKAKMKGKFYIEGHRSKSDWEDENTLVLTDDKGYGSLEEATQKAREYFDRQKELQLAVIFRGDEGELEESLLFY